MHHSGKPGYGSSAIGVWWYFSIGFGAFFAFGSHGLVEVWHNVLLALAILGCVAAPVVGVVVTRAVMRRIEAKKRKPKLRGPIYADYAYIL